jgi:hypothetical protein
VGHEKDYMFGHACASSVCCFVADQVFTTVQLVWLAGDVELHALVGAAVYDADDDSAVVSARLLQSCCCFVTSEWLHYLSLS